MALRGYDPEQRARVKKMLLAFVERFPDAGALVICNGRHIRFEYSVKGERSYLRGLAWWRPAELAMELADIQQRLEESGR